MKKNILTFLFVLLSLLTFSGEAQSTFDVTAVASWQELPSTPSLWKAGTNYKVTEVITITGHGRLPDNTTICIASNGTLNLNEATITCDSNTAIYVIGGKLAMYNSIITTGKGGTFTEGELGTISMQNSAINLGQRSLFTINGKAVEGTNSSIVGNSTAISAPIKKIFTTGINVAGTWLMDRAYPQWFEDSNNADWATAINKAIIMKGTGEVFLPRGNYVISSTIYVSFGIKLVGEPGREKTGYNTDATVIMPSTGKNNFNGGYMMLVNVKHKDDKGQEINVSAANSTWEVHYPNSGTELNNLSFICKGNQRYKAVLVSGGITVNHIRWNGCLQALASTSNTYNDQRCITNCTFYPAGKIKMPDREELYAFDLKSLGDALVFTGNAVHNGDSYTKSLRLLLCDGGTIHSNILNADVLIDRCKSISFTSNHCENGATITIKASTVVNNANFYEKGTKPSIIITNSTDMKNSVVTINGDQFVYYNGVRSNNPSESPDITAARLKSISENDIAIDSRSQLTLNDVYRYDVPLKVGIDKQNLFGIQVASIKNNGKIEPDQSFNRYSHHLSKSGIIRKSNNVEKPVDNPSPGRAHLYLYGKATATWFGETGDYTYSYEILDTNGRVTNKSLAMSSYTENNTTIHLEKGESGVLFCLSDKGDANNRVYVRMQRNGADGLKTVEVPVAGSEHLYDNGVSVAGYIWK